MDASVNPSWFAPCKRTRDHNDTIDSLVEAGKNHEPSNLRHHKRIFDKSVELLTSPGDCECPMLSDERPPFPPPEPESPESSHCVYRVRTTSTDKSDGSSRFVHNSRKVNQHIPWSVSSNPSWEERGTSTFLMGMLLGLTSPVVMTVWACSHSTRNMWTCRIWPAHIRTTRARCEWLLKAYPCVFIPSCECFVFVYSSSTLPFGLSSRCHTFNNLISALTGFWRRYTVDGEPFHVSFYIDDIVVVHPSFRGFIRMAIMMVYETASLGLYFKIPKCSFFPRHRHIIGRVTIHILYFLKDYFVVE